MTGSVTQRGLALVIVLWVITLLAIMAGSFVYTIRLETRLASSTVERAQARALAEAGINYALAWQLDSSMPKHWPPNGDPHEWEFGGERLRIAITDAGGLINLNTVDPGSLKALLKAVDVPPGDQEPLAQAILAWRGQPNEQPTLSHGALSDKSASPKNAPFESLEELGQVPGVSREIYTRIATLSTVYSSHYGVNPDLAPGPVLSALGLDQPAVADYVQARRRPGVAVGRMPVLPTGDTPIFFSQSLTNVYHVTVVAEMASGTAVSVEAVWSLMGGSSVQNLRRLVWREGGFR